MAAGASGEQQGKQGARRYAEFDSIRGLAAVTIAFDHWRRIYAGHGEMGHLSPMRFLLIGHGCVLVFFVLSGLVLSMPQVGGRTVHYPTYLVKRLLRIYPAYLVGLGVAVAGCMHWHGGSFYGQYFASTWAGEPTRTAVADAVRLIGVYNPAHFNMSYWTLVQEMRISLIFPFLCVVILAARLRTAAVLVALLAVAACALERGTALSKDVIQTVAYLGVFSTGILCAKHLDWLNGRVARASRRAYWMGLLAVLAVLTSWTTTSYHAGMNSVAWDIALGFVAAAFILLALRPDGFSRVLLRPVPRFLGKISYSIYLLHGSILWMFSYAFLGRLSPLAWLPLFAGTTLLAAWGLYLAVEVPSIRAGRAFESAMKRRQAGRREAETAGSGGTAGAAGAAQWGPGPASVRSGGL